MKKMNYIKGLLTTILLMCASATWAYDFSAENADGVTIYYSISGSEVAVSYRTTSYNSYSGNVVIPETVEYDNVTYAVTSIDNSAFRASSNLTEVTIPNSVTRIGNFAFCDCTGLTRISLPEGLTSIGERAFFYCWELSEITIPNSVTKIGGYCFWWCIHLSEVTLSNSLTSIEEYTFGECYDLTKLTIPNSVTRIYQAAFANCTKLTEVAIGNSVMSLAQNAFYGCSALEKIFSLNPEPPSCSSSSVFSGIDTHTCVLYVPIDAIEAYSSASIWKSFSNIMEIVEQTVQTNVATEITDNSTILNATIKAGTLDIQEQGFEYWDEDGDVLSIQADGENMSATLTNLEEATVYSYRAFATTQSGIVYGDTMTFTTLNLSLLNSILEKIDNVATLLDEVWDTITIEYGKVADDFLDEHDAIVARIGTLNAEVESTYNAGNLTEERAEDAKEEIEAIQVEIEYMLANARETYETGVEYIGYNCYNDGRIYTIDGKQVPQLQHGVNVIRYSDGTVKKVLVK